MSMNSLIVETLKPTGVPVGFQTTSSTASTYITFFPVNERGSSFLDDDEVSIDYLLQLDIWSKGDYTDLVAQVITLMKAANFYRMNAQDFYEKDTKIYHKAITFSYTKHS